MQIPVSKLTYPCYFCLYFLTICSAYAADARQQQTSIQPYPGAEQYHGYLLSYTEQSLELHALIARPKHVGPTTPLPILIANHGFHPNPPKYGITESGLDWRPGDYYRSIPQAFALEGFLVVMPDYRGHNLSEGLSFTKETLANQFYARDVLALLPHLAEIPGADTSRIFMWGHSMGGDVSLRALKRTNEVIAASLWSTLGGSLWEQAYYYSQDPSTLTTDNQLASNRVAQLNLERGGVPLENDPLSHRPLQQLQNIDAPLLLHHAIADRGTLYAWSMRLASQLSYLGKQHKFYSYDGADHLFQGAQFKKAVARDVAFFNKHGARLEASPAKKPKQ